MFDRIRRIASSSVLRALTANSVPIAHSDALAQLQYKDKNGTVRTIVTTDDTQTLTNKSVQRPITTLSADGAIAIVSQTAKITKAGVAALTLAAPTAGQEGTHITVISDSANAHVITATGLINDGVTGGAKNTATFAAFAGAAIELVAINLKWAIVSKNVVTVA